MRQRLGVAAGAREGGLVQTGDSVVVGQVSGGGLTVTPLNSSQLVVADQDAPGYDFGVPQVISAQLAFPSALSFDFGPGIFGLGFDAGAFPALGDTTDPTVEIVTNGVPQTFTFPGVGGLSLSFVGLTSDVAISSISVTGGPVDPVFANITTAAVPEPGSASMVTIAAGALLFWRSRLLRRKA